MRMLRLLILAGCTSLGSTAAPSTEDAPAAPPADEPEAAPGVEALPALKDALAAHTGELLLYIDKSDRELTVRKGGVEVRRYRVGLAPGVSGDKDKVREGDLATPEGRFRVVTRNDRSRFHLFLGISYPTTEDAERGLRDGLISARQAQAIREADAAGRVPPWNTRLGGQIGIHGGGGSADWTLGCIAVENDQIEELWEVVPIGTPVEIVP